MTDPQTDKRAILVLDFDDTCTLYSGWKGATALPDPPNPGLFDALEKYLDVFEVHIFSTRSHQEGGVEAMREWFVNHEMQWCLKKYGEDETTLTGMLHFPVDKPPAFMSIDDRGWRFTGKFPGVEEIAGSRTWSGK